MNKHSFILIALLVVFITACTDKQPATDSVEKDTFDLVKVKQRYADIALQVADISEQSYQNTAAIAVTLTTPLDPKQNIQSFFNISDKTGQSIKGDWVISANGLVVYFLGIEPASVYNIDVYKDLTAATGRKLQAKVSQQLETRKMPPRLSFASHGSVLSAKLEQGLPVISVNIDQVDVDFFRVKKDNMTQFLSRWESAGGRNNQSNYSIQEYSPHTELVYSARFDINPPKNSRHRSHLDLNAIDALKQPGIYLAVMKPAGIYDYEKQVNYFTVTDLGLHARIYADRMTVNISSLATGEALPNIALKLVDEKHKPLHQAITDQQGQAHFISPSHKAQLLIASNKHSIGILKLNTPALDLTEFDISGRQYKPVEIFSYGPRDLYRPGETVRFSALLRDADGLNISSLPIKAVIKRPDGQKIKYFTWYPEPSAENMAYYQTEYTLPANAATGLWTVELASSPKNKHQYQFQVEAFLPERMELLLGEQSATDAVNWTNRSDTLKIPVSGQYLYGAPAAKNRLSSKVLVKANKQPVKALKDYYFGQADEKPPIEFFEQDDISLDEQGLAQLLVPSRWKEITHTAFTLKVIASLYESGGRPVTRTIDYTLWPQPYLLGIRPEFDLNEVVANSQLNFTLIKSDVKGQAQFGSEVIATLIKERRDYYWEYSEAEGWHYEYNEKNFKTFEQRIKLDNLQSSISVPVDWGSYLLKIKDADSGQTSSIRFYAGSGWQANQNSDAARPDRVVLTLDKEAYQPAEQAKLHIQPPYAGNAFIMVESSEKALWFKRLSVPAEGMNLDIPIGQDWNRQDLYISVITFRPGEAREKITPNRAVGLIHLPLQRKQRQLNVQIEDIDHIVRPETTLSSRIKISGAKPDKQNYLTLAAVDVGVLNITEFKTPDPFQWFFQPRAYSVEQRDMYHKIIELTAAGTVKPRFGGDADKRAGGARPDSSVKIVSLFSGLVKADKNGEATVNIEIPDFNGRLRLMAVAFNDIQFGSAQADITVAAPVIAEVSLPRFLAAGDQATLTLDLRNQSGEAQNLSLKMSASEPVLLQSTPLSIGLEDQQKKVFQFPISAAEAFAQSEINLSLQNSDTASEAININRQWHLAVRPAYPAVNNSERRIVNATETIEIKPALDNIMLASAVSNLSISARPPINLKQHLSALLRYPYGCLEQTISSTYPWLAVNQQNMLALGLDKTKINHKAIKLADKAKYIEKGINLLAAMQRSNGSFGLWSNKDQEEHWLSAYAADFLLDVRENGYPVPDALLNKTMQRLTEYLNNRGNMYGERYSQAPGHYSFAYKAYAAYVLSRINRAPLGSLRSLFEHHRKQAKSPLPLTHLGIALYTQGDKNKGIQAITESLNKPRNNNLYLSDYGSRLRDISLMSYLLQKHPITVKGSEKLIYQLSDELNNRQYLSTQERNALFRTGLQLEKNESIEWKANLSLDKELLKLQQQETFHRQFLADEIPKSIQLSSTGNADHPLYVQFSTHAYPKTAPEMQMDKIVIERNYYDLEGRIIKPGQHEAGDVLLVHLNVRVKERIKDALVVDLVPAGFELENQNLSNSIKTEDFKIGTESIASLQYYNQVKYQQYLDDRFIAAIDLHKHTPEHLFYLIRAVTKGTYTNPPPYVEDMYRPYIRAIGRKFNAISVN